jgi:hypothetical protein
MDNDRISTSYPSRLILDGVPRAGFNVHLSPFPGSLYAVLEYLGDRHDYDYLMGVTGAAFRRLWNRDDGGNVDLSFFRDPPFRLVFDALGYEWRMVPADKDAMLAAIKESLSRGIPLISFGIIGPPEAGIVTGYDQDGAVLYGWSYFQPDGNRYYEKSDWFETQAKSAVGGLIVIGNRKPSTPSQHDVLVTSLEWAIDLECTSNRPEIPSHVSGLSAYDGWADGLDADADFPPDRPDVMEQRAMIHGDQCIMVEERRDAARFLRRIKADAPPAAGNLEDAAALYDEVADLGGKLWPWADGSHQGAMKPLADPSTRRELARHVRAARDKEAPAVVCLQKALAALK